MLPEPTIREVSVDETGSSISFSKNAGASPASASVIGTEGNVIRSLSANSQGDPVLQDRDARLVSERIDLSDTSLACPTRVEIKGGIDATIVVIPTLLLLWFGLSSPFQYLYNALRNVFTNEDICAGGKKSAASAYFDGGLAAQNGFQTVSVSTTTGNRTMPWLRNHVLMRSILKVWLHIESAIYKTIDTFFPDLISNLIPKENWISGILREATATLGMDKHTPFHFVQRAFRLAGIPDSKIHSWYNGEVKDWYDEKIKEGLSGLHTDSSDAKGRSIMIYFCVVDVWNWIAGKNRLLPENDIVLFPSKKGGRGVRISTMLPGRIVVVFHHSQKLHSNVHPDTFNAKKPNYKPSTPGVFGLRVILFTTSMVDNFIYSIGESEENGHKIFKAWRGIIESRGRSGKVMSEDVWEGMATAYILFVDALQSRGLYYLATGDSCPADTCK